MRSSSACSGSSAWLGQTWNPRQPRLTAQITWARSAATRASEVVPFGVVTTVVVSHSGADSAPASGRTSCRWRRRGTAAAAPAAAHGRQQRPRDGLVVADQVELGLAPLGKNLARWLISTSWPSTSTFGVVVPLGGRAAIGSTVESQVRRQRRRGLGERDGRKRRRRRRSVAAARGARRSSAEDRDRAVRQLVGDRLDGGAEPGGRREPAPPPPPTRRRTSPGHPSGARPARHRRGRPIASHPSTPAAVRAATWPSPRCSRRRVHAHHTPGAGTIRPRAGGVGGMQRPAGQRASRRGGSGQLHGAGIDARRASWEHRLHGGVGCAAWPPSGVACSHADGRHRPTRAGLNPWKRPARRRARRDRASGAAGEVPPPPSAQPGGLKGVGDLRGEVRDGVDGSTCCHNRRAGMVAASMGAACAPAGGGAGVRRRDPGPIRPRRRGRRHPRDRHRRGDARRRRGARLGLEAGGRSVRRGRRRGRAGRPPRVPGLTVAGHGTAVRSIRAGGGRKLLVLLGRIHAYEGHDPSRGRPRRADRRGGGCAPSSCSPTPRAGCARACASARPC